MSFKIKYSPICSLAIVLLAIIASVNCNVIDLSEVSPDEFRNQVEQLDVALVKFYAPWCGYCKRMAPDFEQAGKILAADEQPIPLVKVDCTNEKGGQNICEQNGVNGYPTLKIYRSGRSEDYNDGRDADSIVRKMRSVSAPAVKRGESSAAIDKVYIMSSLSAVFIFVVLATVLYQLARGLWYLKLGHALGFGERFRPKENSWVVITGATDGIGLAYAKEFVRKGYNLLLISRNTEKLQKVRDSLESSKEVRIHQADFSQTDIYDGIEKELSKLPQIDVLINCVGVSYGHPEYFASTDVKQINEDIIQVNSISCVKMCYAVIPRMEQQKRGVILNISSFSARNPCPLLSVYAASKAFVDHFTRSIAYEYANKGITIQSVLPGFVVSNMSKIRKSTMMAPTPEDYVRSQLKTVGLDGQTTGYWSHELQSYITQSLFPIVCRSLASNIAFNQMKIMRSKALKKAQDRKNQAESKKDN